MSAVVEAAHRWIGTPYVHQASCRGAGCDCLGLVRGVWREVFGSEPFSLPPYTPDWGDAPGREDLLLAARELLVERDAAAPAPGQVVLFRMRTGASAKHLGIVSSGERFIHAYSGRGVCESALSAPWRRKIVACFDFP